MADIIKPVGIPNNWNPNYNAKKGRVVKPKAGKVKVKGGKVKPVKASAGGGGGGLVSGLLNSAAWSTLLNLEGSTPQGPDKWRSLGYDSQAQYENAIRANSQKTGDALPSWMEETPQSTGATFTVPGVGVFDSTTQRLLRPADSRLDSPIAGKGPKGNEVGSDADPDEPGLQGPGDPKGPLTSRIDSPTRGDGGDPAPDGSGAKGTNTGFKAPVASTDGYANVMDFLSVQLPESPAAKPTELPSTPPEGARITDEDGREFYGPAFGNPDSAKIIEGISTPTKPGVSSVETADNNRAITIEPNQGNANWVEGFGPDVGNNGPDPMDYATTYSKKRTAQRNAFLNAEGDSIDAANASRRSIGSRMMEGKEYFNVNGEWKQVSTEAARAYRNNDDFSAADLKNAYVGKIKETLVPAETKDITDTSSDSPVDIGSPSDDYQAMGGSAEDAAQISGGGAVGVTIDKDGMKTQYFNKDSVFEFETNNNMPGT